MTHIAYHPHDLTVLPAICDQKLTKNYLNHRFSIFSQKDHILHLNGPHGSIKRCPATPWHDPRCYFIPMTSHSYLMGHHGQPPVTENDQKLLEISFFIFASKKTQTTLKFCPWANGWCLVISGDYPWSQHPPDPTELLHGQPKPFITHLWPRVALMSIDLTKKETKTV
jgi:hypothetical protein